MDSALLAWRAEVGDHDLEMFPHDHDLKMFPYLSDEEFVQEVQDIVTNVPQLLLDLERGISFNE